MAPAGLPWWNFEMDEDGKNEPPALEQGTKTKAKASCTVRRVFHIHKVQCANMQPYRYSPHASPHLPRWICHIRPVHRRGSKLEHSRAVMTNATTTETRRDRPSKEELETQHPSKLWWGGRGCPHISGGNSVQLLLARRTGFFFPFARPCL